MADAAAREHGEGAKAAQPFRRRGAQPLADLVGATLKPAARKRGFASVDLFAYWPDIVGPSFADHTQPERLSWPRRLDDGGELGFEPAVLTVRCEGGRALLLSYEEQAIIARINAIFGFRAVARLRIVQLPITRIDRPRRRSIAPLGEAQERTLREGVAGIADDGLREALLQLGRAVKATAVAAHPGPNKHI